MGNIVGLHLTDVLLGGSAFSFKVNALCQVQQSAGGAGTSKMFFNTRNNNGLLFQMADSVKGVIVFLERFFCGGVWVCCCFPRT